MTSLTLADVKNLVEYEKVRETLRAEIIALKALRRVILGDQLSLLFESRQTVLYQIQEMVRTERIVDEAKIQEEIDAYAPLLPGGGELTATLFIEIPGLVHLSQDEVRETVNRFQGIDRALGLRIGDARVPAQFEAGFSKEEKMAAVQYVRFAVPEAARKTLADAAVRVRVTVEHPHYRAEADLSAETRAELLSDLA